MRDRPTKEVFKWILKTHWLGRSSLSWKSFLEILLLIRETTSKMKKQKQTNNSLILFFLFFLSLNDFVILLI